MSEILSKEIATSINSSNRSINRDELFRKSMPYMDSIIGDQLMEDKYIYYAVINAVSRRDPDKGFKDDIWAKLHLRIADLKGKAVSRYNWNFTNRTGKNHVFGQFTWRVPKSQKYKIYAEIRECNQIGDSGKMKIYRISHFFLLIVLISSLLGGVILMVIGFTIFKE